jgi:hypothetical protein
VISAGSLFGKLVFGGALLWLALELLVRWWVQRSLPRDFYGSIGRDRVRSHQAETGVRAATGPGWLHLGWIADPARERYRVERRPAGAASPAAWQPVGETRTGSFLSRATGSFEYRVWAVSPERSRAEPRLVGQLEAEAGAEPAPPLFAPRIAGAWRTLFRPAQHGSYINDHCIYRDAEGQWRLIGITDKSRGDFDAERFFAVGASDELPPGDGEMREEAPLADFGELAWAPCALQEEEAGHAGWHLFWSPHRLHQMRSRDGIRWEDHRVTLEAPQHRFFRDPMVLKVAPGQWLLYTTARGRYYSRVDVYQSFDLRHWQYIRGALRTARGSERNSPFASTESPTVVRYRGRWYLVLTYNNDSFFWPGLLMLLKIWPGRASYNDTLVLHADDPYDFGCYRGRRRTPNLVTRLEAHAPELVHHPERDDWHITTAGWPWAASLTSGEVAIAPLAWEEITRSL